MENLAIEMQFFIHQSIFAQSSPLLEHQKKTPTNIVLSLFDIWFANHHLELFNLSMAWSLSRLRLEIYLL